MRIQNHALTLAALTLALGTACKRNTTDPEVTDLDRLRDATTTFQTFSSAVAAGYSEQITSCWYHGTQGAMGYHQGNVGLIDATPELTKPEALMYEPQANGSLKLVGVEYIVPVSEWTASAPPTLHGRTFSRNDALGLYTLHVWLWKENPSGIYADWNPAVSCQHADESENRANVIPAGGHGTHAPSH